MSFSDDVRGELAAIAPHARLRPPRRALGALPHGRALHLRGHGEVGLHLDVASAGGRPARVRAPARASASSSEIRTYRRRAFDRATRYQLHVAGRAATRSSVLSEAGVLVGRARAARAAAARVVGAVAAAARAYLRGALLGAGRSAGRASPHLEIRSESRAGAEVLAAAAAAEDARAARASSAARTRSPTRKGSSRSPTRSRRRRERRGAGARRARRARSAKARANRLANADHANLVRASRAAHAQLEAVRGLERGGRLEALARAPGDRASCGSSIRRSSLRELGAKCDPPVTKAAAHRRIRPWSSCQR